MAHSNISAVPSEVSNEAGRSGREKLSRKNSWPRTSWQRHETTEQSLAWQRWSMHTTASASTTSLGEKADHYKRSFRQQEVQHILDTSWFDTVLGLVILVNALAMGVEQQLEMEGFDTAPLRALDNIFLVIYILELALRLFAGGRGALGEHWIQFDFVLVMTGIATNWVLNPLLGGIDAGWPIMVLKAARLLRLARVVRLLMKFPELWVLLRGLVESGKTMFYTLMLLTLVIYVFSSIGTELINDNDLVNGPDADDDAKAVVEKYFYSLPATMLTLIQFVSLDNMVMIYRPLVERDVKLFIFFVTLILVVSIVLMNLVTAVIVNCAIEQASQDKAAQAHREIQERKRLVKQLRQIFLRLDEDGSGDITWDEFGNITESDLKVLAEAMHASDMKEIFRALDVDSSGSIGIEEFCEGIWKVMVSKTPIEMKRIEAHVVAIRKSLREVESAQTSMQELREAMQGLSALSLGVPNADASTLQQAAKQSPRHEAAVPAEFASMERAARAARLSPTPPLEMARIWSEEMAAMEKGVSFGGLNCQPLRQPAADDGASYFSGSPLRRGLSVTAMMARQRASGKSPPGDDEKVEKAPGVDAALLRIEDR